MHLTDVSCDNASIANITRARQQPTSQVQPPGGDPAGWPEVDPQLRRARLDGRTDVVTVGIGAIALPFGECLDLTLAHISCAAYYTNPPEGVEGLDAKLARIRDEYGRMLGAIHRAAPHAGVITVGYPAVLPERGSACGGGPTQLGPITPADIDWLREDALKAMNTIIRTETEKRGDRYVDRYTSSVGHDVCAPEDTQWIEGICGDAEPFWLYHGARRPTVRLRRHRQTRHPPAPQREGARQRRSPGGTRRTRGSPRTLTAAPGRTGRSRFSPRNVGDAEVFSAARELGIRHRGADSGTPAGSSARSGAQTRARASMCHVQRDMTQVGCGSSCPRRGEL